MFPCLLLLLGACNRSGEDTGLEVPTEPQTAYWAGERAGSAFGATVAAAAQGAWVGAPSESGGEVFRIRGGTRSLVLEGGSDLGLGLVLAWDEALGLAVGAPFASAGAGSVLNQDQSALVTGEPGESLGAALLPTTAGWLAAGNRVLRSDSDSLELPSRPRALVSFQGQLVAGLPFGDAALWTETGTIDRPATGDEAGTSLCVGDVDGDGSEELLVGAPGTNTVYLVRSLSDSLEDAATWTAEGGRFGQSVACRFGEAWVGAPLYGQSARGALYRVEAQEEPEVFLEGHTPGSQLGFSLSASADEVWAGAPGTGDTTGRAWCVY